MVDVFQDIKFAIAYEQRNLNIGSDLAYGRFASESIDLAQIPEGTKIVDAGSGTGISTTTLFDKIKNITVTATDRSPAFQEVAKLKFGLSENPEKVLLSEKVQVPYKELLKGKWENKDLVEHLKLQTKHYSQFKDRVNFRILAHENLD